MKRGFSLRTSFRTLTAASAAVLVSLTPVSLTPFVAEPRPAVAAPPIAWTPCKDGFQCATIQVPLDYGNPNGAKISLALIRLPAGDPAHKIGSLLMNPGGPGGSGVDLVRGIAAFLPLEMRGRFDIVGFDPRGILRSTPLRCFETFEQSFEVVSDFAFPFTRAEEKVQRALDQKFGAACAARGGAIRDHMSTADVARDMDSIRQLVGDQKLNYLGFSYGSFLGQVYANLFPGKVRAVVIDGVLDPVAWTTGRGNQGRTVPFSTRLRSDDGAQKTLNEFFRLCDAGGPNCAFSGNSKQRFATLAEKLRKKPIVIEDPEGGTFTFTYADLIGTTLGGLYQTGLWDLLASIMAEVESLADPKTLGRSLKAFRTALGVDTQAQEEYPNVVESFPGVGCSDSVNPTAFNAWPRAGANADRRFGYFGRPWTWASSPCSFWPKTAGQDRYLGPWTARTASPVLVVGNFFDPATRYEGAVTAARLLPNSRLLSYAGWGHTAFFSGNFCVDSNIVNYLVTTKVPKAGTVCQPLGSPFEPVTKAGADRARVLGVPMLPPSIRRAIGGN